jgi:hypothetical protein
MPTPRQTVADILRAARGKIERPENWTQKALARDADGGRADPFYEEATCWCASGALYAIGTALFGAVFEALARAMDGDIPTFNDSHTHAEVLAAFSRAIELAEAQGESLA